MKYNGNEVNIVGHVVNTTNSSNLDRESIYCPETTGHFNDIYSIRRNDIEVTVYTDSKDLNLFGTEVYFYKPNTWDIKYSRNYKNFEKLPEKYHALVKEIIEKHKNAFSHIPAYENLNLSDFIY